MENENLYGRFHQSKERPVDGKPIPYFEELSLGLGQDDAAKWIANLMITKPGTKVICVGESLGRKIKKHLRKQQT